MAVHVVSIRPEQLEAAGTLLFGATNRALETRGLDSRWPEPNAAIALLDQCVGRGETVLVAETGGAVIGIGVGRLRGEVATLSPFAVAAPGRGIGGALMDALIEEFEASDAVSIRVRVPGWSASAFGCSTSIMKIRSYAYTQFRQQPSYRQHDHNYISFFLV